jgi:hypothetical protein
MVFIFSNTKYPHTCAVSRAHNHTLSKCSIAHRLHIMHTFIFLNLNTHHYLHRSTIYPPLLSPSHRKQHRVMSQTLPTPHAHPTPSYCFPKQDCYLLFLTQLLVYNAMQFNAVRCVPQVNAQFPPTSKPTGGHCLCLCLIRPPLAAQPPMRRWPP